MIWLNSKGINLTVNIQEMVKDERPEENQDRIRKRLVLLTKYINANAVVPKLFQVGYIRIDEVESVNIKSSNSEKRTPCTSIANVALPKKGITNQFYQSSRNISNSAMCSCLARPVDV